MLSRLKIRKLHPLLNGSMGILLLMMYSVIVSAQSTDSVMTTGKMQPDMLLYTLTGETHPVAGYIYTYTVGPSALPSDAYYTAPNGTIESYSTTSVTIEWNSSSGGTTSTILAKGSAPTPYATLTVYIQAPPLVAGSISPSATSINYNTSPGTLTSSAASGGGCSGSYGYQWQSSPNGSTWTNISGATSLSYTPGNLNATTYYRVYITCGTDNAATNTSTITVYPPLTTGAIAPGNVYTNYNTSPGQLAATAATGGNGTYAYQWQSSPNGSTWSPISGATSMTYTPGNLTATTYYRRAVTSNGLTVYSNTCTVTVYAQLTGGTISPASATINYNTSPGAISGTTPTGGNGTYTYQWQSSPDGSTWLGISGATSASYTPGSLGAKTYFRRTVTSNGITAYSNMSAITVYPQLTAGTLSPASKSINYNTGPGAITGTAATGGNGTYTYQWQSSPNGSTWTNISGATAASYTPGNLTATTDYRRAVTSNGVTVYSNVSIITVYPQLAAGTISPAAKSINYNTSPGAITGTAPTGGNGTYTYQWQSSPNGSTWTSISGATSTSYTPGSLTATTYYRRAVTSNGVTVYSNVSIITVYPQLVAGTISPSAATINYNTNPGGLGGGVATGGNGTYTYQWQSSPDGSTWTNLSGATFLTYTPADLTAKTYFRRAVTSNGATAYSNVSTITVYPQLTAGTISPAAASINYNTSPGALSSTTPTGGNGAYTYQWQSSPNGSTWTSISGATSTSYTPGNLTATTYYRRAVASNGVTVYSNSSVITVYAQLTAGTISPASASINYNTSPGALTGTTPTGGNGTYTYQWQNSTNGSTWTSISGATSASYTPGNLTATMYYHRIATSNGVNATSGTSTITVYAQLTAGSISPSSASINYNTSPGALSGSTPTGGNGTYTYQWQSSPNGSTWTSISGATSTGYTPGNLTATAYYHRIATSNGINATSGTSTITVYAQLQAGALDPALQQVSYNADEITITGAIATGGNGIYSYQWQSSYDGVSWSNIAGATGNVLRIAPDVIHLNRLFHLAYISNSDTVYSAAAQVVYPLNGGIITVNNPVVASGGSVMLSSVVNASNDNCTTYTYQYQSSPDEQSWTNIGSTTVTGITGTTYFRRQAACGSDTAYSNTVRVRVKPATPGTLAPTGATAPAAGTATAIPMPDYGTVDPENMNYIKTRAFTEGGITDLVTANSQTDVYGVHQSTEYFDGLGRSIQTVAKQQTPGGHDMISTTFYDPFGRIAEQYLPYTDNGTGGGFRTDASTKQPAFYNSQFNNTEGYYYAQTVYEASPLNRVLKQTAPGSSWTGHDVGVSQLDRTNDLYDSVRIWDIGPGEDDLPVTAAAYNPGTLYVQETTDEHDNKVIEYKDLEGHVVLKKVQLADAEQPGHAGWLCTYYVYDDLDNLRFVIPPKAVEWLQANSWTLSLTIKNNLCFSYLYDGRKRMIVKQVPGAGKTEMVYDQRDRLVFSQDSVQRHNNQWITTFYDGLNRPVMTALYPSSSSRTTLQTMMDGITAPPGSSVIYTHNTPAPADIVVNNRQTTISQYTATNSITFLPGFSSVSGDNFTASINASAQITVTDTLYEPSADNPVPDITGYQPLTYTYYDDYSWGGAKSFDNSQTGKLNAGSDPYPDAVTPTPQTRGMVTGTKVRVLNTTTEQWLTTTTYYDDKNRPVQSLSDNITGATDELTSQYDFAGKRLSSYLDHKTAHSGTPETKVLTMNSYDGGGRLLSVTKELNDDAATKKTIASYAYDELGQLVKKSIGGTPSAPLDTLHYNYNIRGWLSGINKAYVNSTATLTPAPGRFFGTELYYDYGFNQPQLNGNIAGAKWKSAGDGYGRAYGYNYDNANRVLKADFTQNNSGTWNNTLGAGTIDFSVSNLTYDPNGNIGSMKQMGLKVNNAAAVDELKYSYNTNSNQLFSVTDTMSDANTTLGDFHDGNNTVGTADYTYDGNGNLTEDLNKSIGNIHYNYLNLPDSIAVSGKGTIRYVYDGSGTKWQKIVTDQTTNPSLHDTTTYIGGFIYNNDTLQYVSTEEGRIRPKLIDTIHGWTPSNLSWNYDYFEKDHLGDTRMVLTDETDEATYAATMEAKNAQVENQLFDNISGTQSATPAGFDNPSDTANHYVSRLNGSDGGGTGANSRAGPAIVLKVMAGDTVTIATRAWYQGPAVPPPPGAGNLLNDLLSALSGGVISAENHGIYGSGDNNPGTVLSGDLPTFFTNKENEAYVTTAPKAFLNWVAFDNQLNMVDGNSGVVQVAEISGTMPAQPLVAPEQIITKNGYIYIYVSNESAQDVFFDNLVIHHNRGPILQEDHYYPFGLTMAGISDQAALKPENRFKYNGIEFNHKEFSDGSGLELYTAQFRGLDPQTGRWWQIDPKPEPTESPYSAMGDNPIRINDPLGDTTGYFNAETGALIATINGGQSYSSRVVTKKELSGFSKMLLKYTLQNSKDGTYSKGEEDEGVPRNNDEWENTFNNSKNGYSDAFNLESDAGMLARMGFAEFRGASEKDMEAGLDVTKNRKDEHFLGEESYKEVMVPGQYSSLNKNDPNRTYFFDPYSNANSNKWNLAGWGKSVSTAIRVNNGLSGISQGAVNYYSPMSMPKDKSLWPAWISKMTPVNIPGANPNEITVLK